MNEEVKHGDDDGGDHNMEIIGRIDAL